MVSIFTIFFHRRINLIKPIILNCLLGKFIICLRRRCILFHLVFRILLLSSIQFDGYLKSAHPFCYGSLLLLFICRCFDRRCPILVYNVYTYCNTVRPISAVRAGRRLIRFVTPTGKVSEKFIRFALLACTDIAFFLLLLLLKK
jgi:hypothetical protein